MNVDDRKCSAPLGRHLSDPYSAKGAGGGSRCMHAIILNDFGVVRGGSDQVAIESARALAEAGVTVTFVAGTAPIALSLTGVENLTAVSLDLKPSVPGGGFSVMLSGLWNRAAARAVRSIFARADKQTTVVHMHGWTKVLSPATFAEIRRSGLKSIATHHDYVSACPNGGFYDYRRRHVCSLHPLGVGCMTRNCDRQHPLHKVWRVLRQILLRVIAGYPRKFRNFITISAFSEKVLRPYLPSAARIYRISELIESIKTRPVNVAANRKYVYIGRLVPEKAPQDFAAAVRRARVPGVVVGDGELAQSIREQYPEIEFAGWRDRRGMEAILREARALVFPSHWYEGQPLVPMEAASMGVPVIAADGGAAAERVRHGESGLLFKTGDVEDLVRAVNRCRDDDLVRDMGIKAFEDYWADPSSSEVHVRCLLDAYSAILAE